MTDESIFFEFKPSVLKDTQEIQEIQEIQDTQEELVTVVSLRSEINRKRGKSYWYAQRLEDGLFSLQKLNDSNVPSGPANEISSAEFSAEYTLELDYFEQIVRPSMEHLDVALQRGEVHREQGELYSAEMEYSDALSVDENNVRATFGLGLTYLAKDDVEMAQEIFSKVLHLKSAFRPEHKHMFNSFGISMRKASMYREALEYYNRGVELDSDDENLFFNIARTHFETGDWEKCFHYLTLCLEKNRGVDEARKFCAYLISKSTADDDMLREMGSGDEGVRRRSDLLNLLRKMQLAAGVEFDDAIEKTHEIRDRMIAIAEDDMQQAKLKKTDYNLDDL